MHGQRMLGVSDLNLGDIHEAGNPDNLECPWYTVSGLYRSVLRGLGITGVEGVTGDWLRELAVTYGTTLGQFLPVSLSGCIWSLSAAWQFLKDSGHIGPGSHGEAISGLAGDVVERVRTLLPIGVALSTLAYKQSLIQGCPVAVGLGVSDEWLEPRVVCSGEIRLPAHGDMIRDGITIMLCGWDDGRMAFRFVHPFGTAWGEGGYGWIPYSYVSNGQLAHEAITVQVPQYRKG